MTKTLFLLLLATALAAPQLQAKTSKRAARSESSSRQSSSGAAQNLVSITPEFFSSSSIASTGVFGAIVSYERAIGESNGVIAELLYEGNSLGANTSVTNLGVGGGFRWYFLGGGNLSGIYAAPMLTFETSTYSSSYTVLGTKTTYSSAATLISVAGEAGYQAKVWENLVFNGKFDITYTSGTYATISGTSPYAADGISLKPSASVGWAF